MAHTASIVPGAATNDHEKPTHRAEHATHSVSKPYEKKDRMDIITTITGKHPGVIVRTPVLDRRLPITSSFHPLPHDITQRALWRERHHRYSFHHEATCGDQTPRKTFVFLLLAEELT